MLDFKSILKPEGSLTVGIATMALVAGLYNYEVGTVSAVHMTPANDTNVAASIKKAGVICAIAVAGLTILSRDANIAILGGATIIAEELTYRHAHMASNQSGQIVVQPQNYAQPATTASVDQSTAYLEQ